MGTFSKSFASIGGVAAGPEPVIHYLKHHARALIFSASMPPAAVATVLACLDVLEREPERRLKLWSNAAYLRTGLQSPSGSTPCLGDSDHSRRHGYDGAHLRLLACALRRRVFTNPVTPPAVPESSCRLGHP
jgi:8-amino-7-oxononanoate synthase